MSKIIQSNKDPKKQPALTPKEKEAAKQVKRGRKQKAAVSHLAFPGPGRAISKVAGF